MGGPNNRSNGPTLCLNCLQFDHGLRNCARTSKCMLCAEGHFFKNGPLQRITRSDAKQHLRCANCIHALNALSTEEKKNLDVNTIINHSANHIDCQERARSFAQRESRNAANKRPQRHTGNNKKGQSPTKNAFVPSYHSTNNTETQFPSIIQGL